MQKGFTLIEVLIYIGLFAIVIGGGLVSTYQIVQSSANGTNHVIIEDEANFLLRKFDWALTGATNESSSGSTLTVTKAGTNYVFNLSGGNVQLKRGTASPVVLNSSNVTVTNLQYVPYTSPQGVKVLFTLTTKQSGNNVTENFTTTKYLRK